MKKTVVFVCLLGLSILLTSCASRPSEFYILKANPSPSRVFNNRHCINLGLGPVKIAKYLDRSQIVTFAGGNKVDISEFRRWAEPLDDNIESVLNTNLRNAVPACEVFDYPWRRSANYQYQVKLNITRFGVSKTGLASLVAQWSIISKEGKTLTNRTSKFLIRLKGNCSYQDVVEAMNKNLSRLSAVIAAKLRRLG